MIYRNYEKVYKLTETIKSKLRKTSFVQIKKDERKIELVLRVTFICIAIFFYCQDIYVNMTSLTSNWLQEFILFWFSYTSFISIDMVHYFLLITFFNSCFYIRALINQNGDDLLQLNEISNKNELNETIKKLVESHYEAFQLQLELFDQFSFVVAIKFVMNTFILSQILISVNNFDWLFLLTNVPFSLLDSWIYCYGSQIVISDVSCKLFISCN